jgi:hypothetical protein
MGSNFYPIMGRACEWRKKRTGVSSTVPLGRARAGPRRRVMVIAV